MDTILRHKLLSYLGGAAIAFSSGSAEAARTDLAMIPEPMMEELLEDVDNDEWRSDDFVSLAELLASDPRSKVRYLTADLLARLRADLLSSDLEPVLATLARDKDPLVQSALGQSVFEWLRNLDELDRARVMLEWSLSDDESIRLAVAGALSRGIKSVGADSAFEHLSGDENPEVRAAVVEAAQRRFSENPRLCMEILGRLSSDESRSVRKSARRAAARVSRPA